MMTHAKRASLLIALILAACVTQAPPPMPPPPPPPPPPMAAQEQMVVTGSRMRADGAVQAYMAAPYAQMAPQPMPGDGGDEPPRQPD